MQPISRAAPLAAAAWLALSGCDRPRPAPASSSPLPVISSVSVAASTAPPGSSVGVVSPPPVGACGAGRGSLTVDKAAAGFVVTDLADLAVAAVADRALVSFAVDGNHGCEMDGCYEYHRVFSLTLDGGPLRLIAPPTSVLGVSPSESAAPFALGCKLALLTQGHAGAAAVMVPGSTRPDTIFLVEDGRVLGRSEKWFSGDFAARGIGERGLALGTGQEWGWNGPGDKAPASVRVFPLSLDHAITGELIVQNKNLEAKYDAPALAARGDRAAVAFREQLDPKAPTRRRLFLAWIDPLTAKATGKPALLAAGDVGKPALLLDGDVLHAVWAARASTNAPYRLRHATWVAGEPAPGADEPLETPTDSALSPSLARIGEDYAVAWMQGDTSRTGRVYAGVAKGTLIAAAHAGQLVSGEDASNARDPRWGEGGAQAILVWSEHRGRDVPRVSWTWCGDGAP